MGRNPCCPKEGLNRGAWTAEEDELLRDFVQANGEGKWNKIPREAGLKRCGKSCRLRWLNYLRPNIKRGNISLEEEDLIIRLHKLLGNKWSLIAGRLPGRTDNEIKNYWNTYLARRELKESRSRQSKSETVLTTVSREPENASLLEAHEIEDHGRRTEGEHETMEGNRVQNGPAESESCDGSSSLTSRDENSSDFFIDFEVGDICLAELLSSDVFEPTDQLETWKYGTEIHSQINVTCFPGEEFYVSAEMVECFAAGSDSEFGSLTSFWNGSCDVF